MILKKKNSKVRLGASLLEASMIVYYKNEEKMKDRDSLNFDEVE